MHYCKQEFCLSLGKLVEEVDKVLSRGRQALADERNGGAKVADYLGDIGALVTHCLYGTPGNLEQRERGERGE